MKLTADIKIVPVPEVGDIVYFYACGSRVRLEFRINSIEPSFEDGLQAVYREADGSGDSVYKHGGTHFQYLQWDSDCNMWLDHRICADEGWPTRIKSKSLNEIYAEEIASVKRVLEGAIAP